MIGRMDVVASSSSDNSSCTYEPAASNNWKQTKGFDITVFDDVYEGDVLRFTSFIGFASPLVNGKTTDSISTLACVMETQNRGGAHDHTMLFPVDEFHLNTTSAWRRCTEAAYGSICVKLSLISDGDDKSDRKGPSMDSFNLEHARAAYQGNSNAKEGESEAVDGESSGRLRSKGSNGKSEGGKE